MPLTAVADCSTVTIGVTPPWERDFIACTICVARPFKYEGSVAQYFVQNFKFFVKIANFKLYLWDFNFFKILEIHPIKCH